jgi:hypothetical protein
VSVAYPSLWPLDEGCRGVVWHAQTFPPRP